MQLDWEIWLDNNISSIIAKWLGDDMGLSVKSAWSLNIATLNDMEIYQKAKDHGKVIIISKDSDLPVIIDKFGTPPKLINLQIGNCHNKVLYTVLKQNIQKAIRLLIDFDKSIVEIY